ncbi:hypothetical protein EV126DRAFT_60640 [Verticillium dahliae]|nr:hypothetical protein EV126DRAFT_60640 [Verticillium dahliae]
MRLALSIGRGQTWVAESYSEEMGRLVTPSHAPVLPPTLQGALVQFFVKAKRELRRIEPSLVPAACQRGRTSAVTDERSYGDALGPRWRSLGVGFSTALAWRRGWLGVFFFSGPPISTVGRGGTNRPPWNPICPVLCSSIGGQRNITCASPPNHFSYLGTYLWTMAKGERGCAEVAVNSRIPNSLIPRLLLDRYGTHQACLPCRWRRPQS